MDRPSGCGINFPPVIEFWPIAWSLLFILFCWKKRSISSDCFLCICGRIWIHRQRASCFQNILCGFDAFTGTFEFFIFLMQSSIKWFKGQSWLCTDVFEYFRCPVIASWITPALHLLFLAWMQLHWILDCVAERFWNEKPSKRSRRFPRDVVTYLARMFEPVNKRNLIKKRKIWGVFSRFFSSKELKKI